MSFKSVLLYGSAFFYEGSLFFLFLRLCGNKIINSIVVKTTNTKSERKRRWKPVEVPKGEDNVVTVTMVEEVNELKEQFMVSEPTVEENRATSFQESITDFKLLTETTDKMEELDYEETVQHTSATDSPVRINLEIVVSLTHTLLFVCTCVVAELVS